MQALKILVVGYALAIGAVWVANNLYEFKGVLNLVLDHWNRD